VDRRDEIPGAHPKVEMPTAQDGATSNINDATPPAAIPPATPGKVPPPAPKPAPKK